MENMNNCHVHLFTSADIPNNFLPLGLVRALDTKVGYFLFSRILKDLNPFSNQDLFERYINFVKIGRNKSQEDIYNLLAKEYPYGTNFFVLPMEMSQMGAGRVPREYMKQLEELTALNKKYPNVLPFVHIDPRNPKYLNYFNYAMNNNYYGVKLYPPLGVFPFDERYDSIYATCSEHKKPFISHCTSGNPVFYKGSKSELKDLLKNSRLPIDWNKSKKDLCAYFTHPLNYQWVFEKFPDLKGSLAHFGRENDWDVIIRDMMKKYKNMYCDISYSDYDESHWGYIKVLLSTDDVFRSRCMYGSDYWMNSMEGVEKQVSINLRAYLGEELFYQISVINPNNFLYS